MAIRSVLRGFAHPNLRLFFAGQALSLVGTHMQIVALPWFVYRITGSAQWLAIAAFAGQFPAVFATLLAGVIADRVDKRRLLLVTQSLAMLQAFTLATLVLTDNALLWHVLVLNVGMGLVSAFDLTCRQAFLSDLIDDRADLGNAIALNSAMFNATRLIGPALAGQVIGLVGEGWCFLANAVSFLAVLAALLFIRVTPRAAVATPSGLGLREAISWAVRSTPARTLLVLVALVSLCAVPYHVLVPVLVKSEFLGDARLNGWMFSAAGLGALTGGLLLASRHGVLGLVRIISLLPALAAFAVLALAANTHMPIAVGLAFVVGLAVVMALTACNMTLQTIVPDRLRGRIMSLYAMTFLGLSPIGGVIAGSIAENWGARPALATCGLTLLCAATVFAALAARPLYRSVCQILSEQGLIPAGTSGAVMEDEPV